MARSKAQLENLKKGKATQFKTGEKQAAIAKKGGIASGKAKRRKKLLKECLDELLEKDYMDKKGNKASGAEALASTLFKKALAGDLKAFELVRDTSGQGVVQKIMVAEVEQSTIDEVERMVLDEGDKQDAGDLEKH